MLKNKFLLIPVLIFLIALAVDRILMLEKIQTYFTKTVSEINYFHKPVLFQELKDYLQKPDRKKVFVYFGNSRALLFDNKYIEEHYPDWILFNFSVPGGTPDYFTFWLEQFQADNVKPDFILVDDSVEAFNFTARIKIDEVLVNGLDFPFILKYRSRYTSKEITNFIAKRLFKTYQYRPKLDTILQRLRNNSEIAKHYRQWRIQIAGKLKEERGSASSDISANATSSKELVLKYSEGDFHSYIDPFTFNENMLAFQKDNFRILKELGVSHSAIWVRVARPYFQYIQTRNAVLPMKEQPITAYSIWYSKINAAHKEFGTGLFNMNEDKDYTCDFFTDASHMSTKCFPDYTDYIFERVIGVKKK
jgi:hypothetical protein